MGASVRFDSGPKRTDRHRPTQDVRGLIAIPLKLPSQTRAKNARLMSKSILARPVRASNVTCVANSVDPTAGQYQTGTPFLGAQKHLASERNSQRPVGGMSPPLRSVLDRFHASGFVLSVSCSALCLRWTSIACPAMRREIGTVPELPDLRVCRGHCSADCDWYPLYRRPWRKVLLL